jgi:hypothetical protein
MFDTEDNGFTGKIDSYVDVDNDRPGLKVFRAGRALCRNGIAPCSLYLSDFVFSSGKIEPIKTDRTGSGVGG